MVNLFFGLSFLIITFLFFKQQQQTTLLEKTKSYEVKNEVNGSVIYKTKCISCHNADPTKQGAVGPDIANSSFELIKEKTQNRKYPDGYKPKRKSNMMPRIPLTDEQIKALEIFLKRM